jgi:hypothetical protein
MKPRILHLMTMPGICCAPCMSTSNGSVFCTPNECCLQSCCVLSNISMEKLVKLMLTKPELKISATTEMINASIGMADAGCCELWKLGRCYCIRNRVWLSHGQLQQALTCRRWSTYWFLQTALVQIVWGITSYTFLFPARLWL